MVLAEPIANQVGTAFGIGHAAVLIWDIAKWPVLVIIVSVMYSLLCKASPNVRQPAFRWISACGILAVIIWLIASGLFAVYVSFAGSYNKTYGSLATVIIFLVWLWISNIAIPLGAEFNAETQRERAIRAGLPEGVEPFTQLRDPRRLHHQPVYQLVFLTRSKYGLWVSADALGARHDRYGCGLGAA